MPLETTYLLLALLGGLGFATVGIALRLGQMRQATVIQIMAVAALIAVCFFILNGGVAQLLASPLRLWIFGLLAGVTQILAMLTFQWCLQRGPLSPVWCALSLYFIPAALLGYLAYDETIGFWQWLAMACAVACVLCGGFLQDRTAPAGSSPPSLRQWLIYVGLLILVFLLNCVCPLLIKVMGMMRDAQGQGMLERHGEAFYLLLYFSFFLIALLLMQGMGQRPQRWKPVLGFGLMAATGSVLGMIALGACAAQNAAVVYGVVTISSLLFAGVISVCFLRERARMLWWIMMALALITVILFNLNA